MWQRGEKVCTSIVVWHDVCVWYCIGEWDLHEYQKLKRGESKDGESHNL